MFWGLQKSVDKLELMVIIVIVEKMVKMVKHALHNDVNRGDSHGRIDYI
jgi:hypothetical protein